MSSETLVCANHPRRETTLRCNRCEKPICTQCAVLTEVGYRCRACVRGSRRVFETARRIDLPIAVIISAVGVGLGIQLLTYLGFWGFLLAAPIGGGLAELVRGAVRRRRGRVVLVGTIVGGALGVLIHLGAPLIALVGALFGVLPTAAFLTHAISAIWPIGYGALMVSTLYYRLRGPYL